MEIHFTQIQYQNYPGIVFPSPCYSTKGCGKCYDQNQNYNETQNTSVLMNETLRNAMTEASSLGLISQICP